MVDKIQPVAPVSHVDPVRTVGRTSVSDPYKESSQGLNVDQFGLSKDARNKVEWARAQFELNYQVLKSVNSSQGFETSQETFSFQGSYEFLQQASGGEFTQFARSDADEAAVEEAAAQDQLSALQEYFSPENTALRILDVATSFFGVSDTGLAEGNVESARRKFADFIGGAINEGFSQARAILGDLPEDVSSGIDKTHSLVFSGLEDFVKNGIDPEKARPGGVYEKIAAYRAESAARFSRINSSSSSVSYSSNGEKQTNSADNSKISTEG